MAKRARTPEQIMSKLRERATKYTKDDALDELQLMMWLTDYGVYEDVENYQQADYYLMRYFPRVLGIEWIAASRLVKSASIDYSYKDGIALLSGTYKKHEIFAMAMVCSLLGIDFAYASMILNHLTIEELLEQWVKNEDFEEWFVEVTDIDIELAKSFIGHYPNKELPNFLA